MRPNPLRRVSPATSFGWGSQERLENKNYQMSHHHAHTNGKRPDLDLEHLDSRLCLILANGFPYPRRTNFTAKEAEGAKSLRTSIQRNLILYNQIVPSAAGGEPPDILQFGPSSKARHSTA
jgi:hypothetical protein